VTDTARLEKALGYSFSDVALLRLALTHRSAGGNNNERLEFLGDSVVNHIIAEELYHRFPRSREGEMSRMRAALVRGDTLAEVARELDLGDYVQLGRGERKSGGHRRSSILADTFEAVIGAILLDSDIDACRSCVKKWFARRLDEVAEGNAGKDAKTRLQEFLQGRNHPLPDYVLLGVEGDDHDQSFHVACQLASPELVAEGRGSSRRKAEQAAAACALEQVVPNVR
jgi:ribonuclease III